MARGRESGEAEDDAESAAGPSSSGSAQKPRKKPAMGGDKKPLEVFGTHLISAMKIGDNDHIDRSSLIKVTDQWRHEWNNGVQIPVGHDEAQHSSVTPVKPPPPKPNPPFKPPKKLIRVSKGPGYSADSHAHSTVLARAEEVCRYDLDDLDSHWLALLNRQRKAGGASSVAPETVERLMEHFEKTVYEGVQADLAEAGNVARGREYEEDSVCDVCWMPDSSDDNQMVFCDRCDLAVHQICYGTGDLPDGAWLCRACAIQPKAQCVLCPNRGGALKCTRTGLRWAHVSCVWWIPEVKFEDPDTMEPVIHISKIPADRWNLKCAVCGKREGACIQCSSHKCPVAYHVTCAQMSQPHINMQWETVGSAEDNVNLISFCRKHTRTYLARKGGSRPPSASPTGPSSSQAPSQASTSLARAPTCTRPQDSPLKRRLRRQAALEARFYTYVQPDKVSGELTLPSALVHAVFEYWKLKRRSRRNESMMTPKVEEELILEKHDREVLMRKVKVFVALRQNLEKARNLLYMVQKRERLKRQYLGFKEEGLESLQRLLCPADSVSAVSTRELDKLALSLGPTSDYEQEAFCSEEPLALEPASPDPLPPPPPLPKAIVHLKRLPAAQLVRRREPEQKRTQPPLLKPSQTHNGATHHVLGNGFRSKRPRLSSALVLHPQPRRQKPMS